MDMISRPQKGQQGLRALLLAGLLVGSAVWGRGAGGWEGLPVVYGQIGLSQSWRASNAEFLNKFDVAAARVRITDASGAPVLRADFYAEFLDSKDRICQVLTFSTDDNIGGKRGQMRAGETRTLKSSTFFLVPASEPIEMRLYLLREIRPSQSPGPLQGQPVVRVPVTVRSPLARLPWERLRLGPELKGSQGPFADLLLADVHVDASGTADSIEVLDSASGHVRDWFLKAASHLRFSPARVGTMQAPGDTLIFVRAWVSRKGEHARSYPASDSPWLRHFLRSFAGIQDPPVTVFIMTPRSSGYWAHPGPADFDYLAAGSQWYLAPR
jgi:hypothetical protein